MANNISKKIIDAAKSYTYIPNNFRTSLVVYLFWLFTFLSAIVPMIGAYTLIKYSTAAAENYDTVSGWVGIIFLLCAIAFLFWIYRASVNTHALNPQTKIEFSPGWCVGCYFIPVLNLYWPYKSMKELWTLNVKKETDIILSWWITYLILNFTATAISKFNHLELVGYILLDTASNISGIISAVIAIKIFKEINAAQINRFQAVITNKRTAP